jgi:urease accessory protein
MSVLNAPELALYHDEPKQMPSSAPGKHGVLDMAFARRGDRSVLAHLYRKAPLLVQQALYWDEHLPGLPCVYIITTSGCVLQGDRLDMSVTVGPGAMAHVTTQAATKIHQMDANFAAASQQLALADNSYLEMLPGPVIPHRHSRFITHTRATVADSATLLGAELLQPGRKHHGAGELFEFDLYSSTLTASRPDATPLFTEKLIAEPRRHPVRQAGVMANFDVFANVTLITPRRHADQIFEQVVPGADASAECVAGASRLPNDAGLVYKVLGMETEPVKAKIRAFWDLVRQQVLGAPIPAARPWGSPLLPAAAGEELRYAKRKAPRVRRPRGLRGPGRVRHAGWRSRGRSAGPRSRHPGPVVDRDQIRHHGHGTADGRITRSGARRGRTGRHPR